MASHRMPDEDRPRRAVPAWVTAPPEGTVDGLEARPAPVTSAPEPETAGPGSTLPAPTSVPALVEDDLVVPDYPPEEHLLPPAPTSPAVHTVPFDTASLGPAPVSPIDAAAPPAPVVPAVPVVGQPRFSVPGLEHVVVEGTEPEPTGPIGYRTPARFAHQQRPLASAAPTSAPAPAPERSFDAVLAPPPVPGLPGTAVPATPASTLDGATAPATPIAPGSASVSASASGTSPAATGRAARAASSASKAVTSPKAKAPKAPRSGRAPKPTRAARARAAATPTVAMPTVTAPAANAGVSAGAAPRLQADTSTDQRTARRPLVGATPGAALGAVAGLATLGFAAWWFTAPATVHAVGLVLGVLAVVLSVVTLRNAAATWQRPVALLGVVLGGVGTLVLLWAVASAVLATSGVTLPDLTGTGTVPTLAP